ncbi:alpha/beta hydrolase [Chromobacterium aquaticum]|uniref:Alpha/beta hydrolase n=1 Tax=Chromobacterium aquaticum TaxID=467180 RepID=A0ABV8ZQ26_9NEIS|nr:alpha/beta hydrolase [Chromobacterium aquaticum]MCD5360812.1 alpha/beta hydrolase [Chromobacterium aquaticum]
MGTLKKILALLAAVLLALSLWELAQRYFILSPSYQTGKTPQDYGVAFKVDWLPVPQAEGGGLVHAWWLPAESSTAPAVLFLHGNDSTLHTDIDLILSLRRLGLAVMAIDYRGYGDGAWYLPSQHSVYADARVAWQAFKQRSPEASKHLVYGHSLGGAIAMDMAAVSLGVDGVIVDGGFLSVADIAKSYTASWLPFDALIRHDFSSYSKLAAIAAPKLFIHCSGDDVVPMALGERLYQLSSRPKAKLFMQGGDHDACYRRDEAAWQRALDRVIKY